MATQATPPAPTLPASTIATPDSSTPRNVSPSPDSPPPAAAADTLPPLPPEEAFLDTLRELEADSLAPSLVSVPDSLVRQEAASLFGRPTAAAAAATWDIDVQSYASHGRVQYWIDFYMGRARRHFEIYLSRVGRWDSLIRTRLATAGLPQDLIYLAMIESGLNPVARSRAGAVGLWQFIPGTGRRYGLAIDAWVDERRDPFLATDAAIRFLSELNARFGSLYLAAAAYNSGPGRIERGLARHDFGMLNGDERFFALAEGPYLRRETRDYVPKLIAAALLAKEPERWGFTGIERLEPLRYDSVRVRYAVGLDVLGRLADTTRAAMEELNPQLYRGVTPPDREVWVRVPIGSAERMAERLATLPPRERVTVVVHYVTRGETLSRIARQYGVSVEDIRSANGNVNPRRLQRGQRLIIPTSLTAAGRRAMSPSSGRGSGVSARAGNGGPGGAAATTGSGGTLSRRVHIVRPGETLTGIAQRFDVRLSDLLRANNLDTGSTIRPGQAVRIP